MGGRTGLCFISVILLFSIYPASQWATKAKAGPPTGSDIIRVVPVEVRDLNQASNNADASVTAEAVSVTAEQQKAAIELYRKAREYEDLNEFDSAKQICEQIIRDYPGTIKANNSILDIQRLAILEKMKAADRNETNILLDKYFKDFNNNLYAIVCINREAMKYFRMANAKKDTQKE